MPGGDRTGPMGAGPATGRRAGFCAGFDMPGFVNRGMGGGFGRGMGGGFGRGMGRGFRNRNWARSGGWGWWNAGPNAMEAPTELQDLKQQSEDLERTLKEIRKRMSDLEARTEDR